MLILIDQTLSIRPSRTPATTIAQAPVPQASVAPGLFTSLNKQAKYSLEKDRILDAINETKLNCHYYVTFR